MFNFNFDGRDTFLIAIFVIGLALAILTPLKWTGVDCIAIAVFLYILMKGDDLADDTQRYLFAGIALVIVVILSAIAWNTEFGWLQRVLEESQRVSTSQ